ncbi:hypothetical protein B0H14DRAFT_3158622 [Mycena olivaceomarginata]|nr:hypothetical protein B0H14DRAFT_3158622 [Mycena olivaceomarginata]
MRAILATFGVAVAPLGWCTTVKLGMTQYECRLLALTCFLIINRPSAIKSGIGSLSLASFKIHFMVLDHSGPDDAQMSSPFQNLWPRYDEPAFDPEAPIRFPNHNDVVRLPHGLTGATSIPTQFLCPQQSSATRSRDTGIKPSATVAHSQPLDGRSRRHQAQQ